MLTPLFGATKAPDTVKITKSTLEGKNAPLFTLKNNNNRFFFLSKKLKTTKKRFLALTFFTNYCKACKKERKLLREIAEKYKNMDIIYIAVREGDNETINEFNHKAKELMKSEKMGTVLLDIYSAVSQNYKIKGVPRLLFIDTKTKKIVKDIEGFHPTLEKIYQNLMNKK